MFGLRVRIDATQRSKKGHPAHNTTGVASTSSVPLRSAGESEGDRTWPNIARMNTTPVSGSVHQKRRLKSVSSGFSACPAPGISGSSAMPHLGQTPGPCWRISGCMGQM